VHRKVVDNAGHAHDEPDHVATRTTAAVSGDHLDGGIVISDLRGGIATGRAVSALGVLEDPTGRRARIMRRAAVAVGVLFSFWLVGLTLCGLGLLPSGSLPLSSALAPSNGPPPFPAGGLQRAGAASDKDGQTSLATGPGRRQAAAPVDKDGQTSLATGPGRRQAAAPGQPSRALKEQRSLHAPGSRAASGPTDATPAARGGRLLPAPSAPPASAPAGRSQPTFAAPVRPGTAGQTPVTTGALPAPAAPSARPAKRRSHPAPPAKGTSGGSSSLAPGQVLAPGQRSAPPRVCARTPAC